MATQSSRDKSPRGFESTRDWVVPMPVVESQQPRYQLEPIERIDNATQVTPSWRSLFSFTTRAHSAPISCSAAASILAGILKPCASIFLGKIFSILTKFGDGTLDTKATLHGISIWCIALTGLGLSAWLLEGIFFSAWVIFGELQAQIVRLKMFAGMLDKELEWYDLREDGVGSLLIRIQTQIRELQLAVSQPLGLLLFEAVASLASLGIALYYSWKLTLVILATFPFIGLILFIVSKGLAPAIESQKRELSKASKYANTAVTAIDTVKAFNGQDQEIWQYFSTIKEVTIYYLLQARANALQFGIIKFLTTGLFVQGFWFGIYLVNNGLDPGDVLTTFYACLSAMQAIEVILPQWLVLAKGMSAGETLKSIMIQMQHDRRVTKVRDATTPKSCPGDVEINNVSFAYPSNTHQLVLDNVTFFFPTGETTFVVGTSGSGKSTVGNLLMKYYEPLSGEILVDGHSIQNLDNDWLRQNITLVQQESVLFNETIFQNIAFGNRDNATREDVREACKTAYLEETIRNMPNGLDTLIGLGGRSLSGGQKQRVAIARAKLRDAPILILDESTSALDYISRIEVMESIRKWRKGKTTIIITHDMSQILDDDYVYVLDHAKVVQEDYRKKLADKSHGTFASILRSETSSEAKRLSKKPEPSSLTNDVEIPEEAYSQRWSYISKVFGMPQNSPNIGLSSGNDNRLSLKVGVAQASSLSSDLIWPSPHVTDSPQTSIIPRPHLSFMSPRPSPQAPPPSSAWKGTDYNPSPIPSSNFEDMKHGESTREKVPDHITEDAQELPPASLTKIFSTIWPILTWKGKMVLLLGFFAAFIVAAGTPAFAYVFAQLLNVFYLPREDRTAAALKWALSLLAVAVIDGSASFCTHYALEYSAQSWINSLRLEALKRILAQPKSWFDEESNSPGRLNDCLDRNAEEMRNLVGRFAGPAFTIVWMLGITVVWSLIIVWKLTLVALGCAPILYAFTRLFHLVSSKWEERCNRDADFTSSIFSETFTNIRVVRALTLESHFEQKHLRAAADTCKTGISRAVYSGLLYGLTDSLTFFIIALVFYYGTVLICSGSHSLGNVIEVVNLLLFGISNATAMLSMVPQITSSRTTATYMLRLANLPLHTSHETQGEIRVPTPLPIRMNNLSFTHPSQPFIKTLDRISLEIKPGTCTAIVGSSGSGKSTIVSLLLNLYPPDAPSHTFSGPALTFHGIPACSCNLHSLRSHISIVPQSPLLFPTTILENIIYGLPESSPFHSLEAAQRAAAHAGIHSFIMSLDAGYSTLIGDGGMGLSGGQTQRLALARALVRRPKLLILDEATSALDGGNAQLVKELVGRLVGEGVAVVLVSHSLEMVKVADCVLVLEKGRLVESGGFEELCGRGGVFGRVMMGGGTGIEMGRGRGERLRVDKEDEKEDEDIITPVEQRKRSSWVGRTEVW